MVKPIAVMAASSAASLAFALSCNVAAAESFSGDANRPSPPLGSAGLTCASRSFFRAVVSGHRQIEKVKLGIRGGQTSTTPGRWTWIASAWRLSRAFFGWPFLGGCFCCACVATSLLGRLLFSHADFAWSLTASGFVRSLTHHGLRVRQSLYKVRWTPLHERASLKEPGDATSLQPLHCLDHTP